MSYVGIVEAPAPLTATLWSEWDVKKYTAHVETVTLL